MLWETPILLKGFEDVRSLHHIVVISITLCCVGLQADARIPGDLFVTEIGAERTILLHSEVHADEAELLSQAIEAQPTDAEEELFTRIPRRHSLVPWRFKRDKHYVVVSGLTPLTLRVQGIGAAFSDQGMRVYILLEGAPSHAGQIALAIPKRRFKQPVGPALTLRQTSQNDLNPAQLRKISRAAFAALEPRDQARLDSGSLAPEELTIIEGNFGPKGALLIHTAAPLSTTGTKEARTWINGLQVMDATFNTQKTFEDSQHRADALPLLGTVDLDGNGNDEVLYSIMREGNRRVILMEYRRKKWRTRTLNLWK